MKKFPFFSILSLVLLIVLVSCEKETFLSVDQSSVEISDAGGSATVSLTANKPWSASSNQSWCKVSPSAGVEATNSRITISCDPNTTYDARNCTVTFTCAELTKTISVSQATNNGLLVSQTEYNITNAAQQLEIKVQANVKFSVEVDNGCKNWVKYKTTKGLTTSTVVLDIAKNESYDNREGKVTIKQDGGNLSSTITIKQSQLDGLFITTPEYNLSNEKHTLTVEVSTNVEFEVTPQDDWVKYVQTKGLNNKQIILEVAENDTYDQRETTVAVKQKNGDLSGTIKIKQDEKYGILVTQSEYTLSNEAQTIDVEVKYNVDYDVAIPDECKNWVSIVGTKGLSSKTYTFAIAKNESYDNRECSITFKQKNGSLSGTVVISQSQTDGLIAEKTEYKLTADEQSFDIKIKANVSYDVVIDDSCKDWLTFVQTKGLAESIVSLMVTANFGDTRRGKVYLKSEGIQEMITIVQEAEGYVEFDDDRFKYYCVWKFDTNADGRISFSEAKKVFEIIIPSFYEDIMSLKGIESFCNLRTLECRSHKLTNLDVSHNTELISLDCSYNQIASLNVSGCSKLIELNCASNMLTDLDLQGCPAIMELNCNSNKLSIIDIHSCPVLLLLECGGNNLTSIDVSGHTSLTSLFCSFSPLLVSINVNGCTSLRNLDCYVEHRYGVEDFQGKLTNIELGDCVELNRLDCHGNVITSLDCGNNTKLVSLVCYNNQITRLNVSKCSDLTILSCWNNQLIDLDASGCPALLTLMCQDNQLTNLDISGCAKLTELNCSGNRISALDVSGYKALTTLSCTSNPLTTLNASGCTSLIELDCINWQLTSLDVSGCTALTELILQDKKHCGLTSLDVSGCTALTKLNCSSSQLTTIDVSTCIALAELHCDGNPLTSIDISKNTALIWITCSTPTLTTLDVSNNVALKYLSCCNSPLENLILGDNYSLQNIQCYENQLTSLDLSKCTALECLNCYFNPLTGLDFSNCPNFRELNCKATSLTTLDFSNNPLVEYLDCTYCSKLSELWLKTGQTIKKLYIHKNVTTIKYRD